MRLGQTITEIRKERNMTQEDFARIFHVTVFMYACVLPLFEIKKATTPKIKIGITYPTHPNNPKITEEQISPAIPPRPKQLIIRKIQTASTQSMMISPCNTEYSCVFFFFPLLFFRFFVDFAAIIASPLVN